MNGKITKTVFLSFFMAATLALCLVMPGCVLFSSPQTKAIEAAITAQGNTTPAFRYIGSEGLNKQVRDQTPSGDKPDVIEYSIDFDVPDVDRIDPSTIKLTSAPEFDLNSSDLSKDKDDFAAAAEKDLEAAMENHENLPKKNVTLKVAVSNEDGNWVAAFDQESVDYISGMFTSERDGVINGILDNSPDYGRLLIAEANLDKMISVFGYESYAQAVRIDSIEYDGASYKVKITYPDPEEVFGLAVQSAYASYAAKGKSIFGTLKESDAEDSLKVYIPTAIQSSGRTANASYTVTGPDETDEPDSLAACKESITGIHDGHLKDLISKVEQDCVVPEASKPKSGVISGKSSGQSVMITSAKGDGDRYLAFYLLPGNDVSKSGKLSLAIYLANGESCAIKLPAGNYKLVEGTGAHWYGDKYAFGPEGRYATMNQALAIQKNFHYTLNLGSSTGANLPSTPIDYPYGG